MKTNKILSSLAAGLLLFAGACTEEVSYDPAEPYSGDEVYFNLDEIGELEIEQNATSVSFHLYRVDTSKEINVALESSVVDPNGEDASSIFTVPTTVTFPSGTSVVEVLVGIDFDQVVAETEYSMSVKIAGDDQTPYGATSGDFTMIYGTKYEDWAEYLPGQYATFQMAGAWTYLYEAPVYYRESINMPNLVQYTIEDPFSDVDWEYLMTVHHDFPLTVDGEEGDVYLVTMDDIDTTVEVDSEGNTLMYRDVYTFIKAFLEYVGVENPSDERILNVAANNGFQVAYINETTGYIALSLIAQSSAYYGTGSYSGGYSGVQQIQLPGFKSYNVAIYEAGYEVDATGSETKKFTLYKNDDTPVMKYAMYQGTLTDDEVSTKAEELLADEEAESIEDAEYTVAFELESGDYTLLLIGVDNDQVVVKKTYAFTYEPSVSDGYVTVGTAEYSDAFMTTIDSSVGKVTVTCDVQTNPDKPGIYRLKNPYRAWAAATGYDDWVMEGNYYIYLNCEDANLVYIEEFNLGLREDVFEGPVYGYSKAAQSLANGMKPATVKLRKLCGKLSNNVITFPTSTLLVAFQSELPDYQEANTLSSFRVELNISETSAPIRGTHVATEARTSRINGSLGTVNANM